MLRHMSAKLGRIHDVAEELAHNVASIADFGILAAKRQVPEHVHDNPYLWLHVLGSYRDAGDCGALIVDCPAAMFFPAGSAHQMTIGSQGLASVIVEFDSERLRRVLGPAADLKRPRHWVGGSVGRGASRLARMWLASKDQDAALFAMSEAFLRAAMSAAPARLAPPWLERLDALVKGQGAVPRTERLASQLGVSAPWLVRAYRHWRGEGLGESLRRRRVETAAILLETEDAGLADVAVAAGFCDQSHMARAFKRHVGRTPAAIRAARLGLAGIAA